MYTHTHCIQHIPTYNCIRHRVPRVGGGDGALRLRRPRAVGSRLRPHGGVEAPQVAEAVPQRRSGQPLLLRAGPEPRRALRLACRAQEPAVGEMRVRGGAMGLHRRGGGRARCEPEPVAVGAAAARRAPRRRRPALRAPRPALS